MNRNELQELLNRRTAQIKVERDRLSKVSSAVYRETLRLACNDLEEKINNCIEFMAEHTEGMTDREVEECVKATLMDVYMEFCRCRDRA